MQLYTENLFAYQRLKTREVKVGNLLIGNGNPIRIQTMTTTDTMDTAATVAQTIRCIQAGAELVRITAPSKTEAENLQNIKDELLKQGYDIPLIADIHFTPNAAEIAARIVQKVRVNPGNYVDKKKFEQIEYTDEEYIEEIQRIKERFTPLVLICKQHGTAMRIGTNHGSLSDRIMSRYGDTAIGMVESALEFLRIARSLDYHQIILSMKSSNPQVMVQAYRLLIVKMMEEFGECYPLHLGVTEAGDGEDGRIKSAIGIGTLLQDGIGDTIRVSLTEDPEFELPVCMDIIKDLQQNQDLPNPSKGGALDNVIQNLEFKIQNYFSPFQYSKRKTFAVHNIGANQVPIVVADISSIKNCTNQHLQSVGYTYNETSDKWTIADIAADYIYIGNEEINFNLPTTLGVIYNAKNVSLSNKKNYFPIWEAQEYIQTSTKNKILNFVMLDANDLKAQEYLIALQNDTTAVLCFSSEQKNAMQNIRGLFFYCLENKILNPTILICDSNKQTIDEHLIHFAQETGALFLDGFGDGISLGINNKNGIENKQVSGRTYMPVKDKFEFINNTSFGILQATRTRISKTEYISCPSCGRTLFDLQETTSKIRAVTHHLKGVKIAIMGCIVNGPGEMADADFGYVGSGVGKITLYKNKEVVKRNIDSAIAVDELINLIKESGAWVVND